MLVIVADHRRCQFYVTDRLQPPWTNVESLINASAHLAEHDLGSDAPGRVLNRTSGSHQAYDASSSIHEEALRKFAHEIAECIAQHAKAKPAPSFAFIAEPRLLHEIKAACPASVRASIALEIAKDLVQATLPDVAERLRAVAANR